MENSIVKVATQPMVKEKDVKHYMITSDIHFSIDRLMEEAEQLLRYVGFLFPKFSARCRLGASAHILKTLQESLRHGPFDGLIDLGDRTHGKKKTGLSTSHTIAEAHGAMELLKMVYPELPLYLVPGNHDLGWALSLLTLPGNGYLAKSISKYREIYGPLFGADRLSHDVILLRIASEPFYFDYLKPTSFRRGENQKEIKDRLELLRNELAIQLAFVKQALEGGDGKQKFILAVHEPSALFSPRLRSLLDSHRERLLVTLTGHVHARWLMNSIRAVRPKLNWIFSRYKIQMIPSVWGIDLPVPGLGWGPGAGWARLTIEEERGVTLYVYHTNSNKFRGIELS